ncbi:putative membrane protein [Acinetobacter sp. 742879]|nr:putative membrane protein [Acinetobacter sp. 742879]
MKVLIVVTFFILTILALIGGIVSGDKVFIFIAFLLFLATWLLKSSLKIEFLNKD